LRFRTESRGYDHDEGKGEPGKEGARRDGEVGAEVGPEAPGPAGFPGVGSAERRGPRARLIGDD